MNITYNDPIKQQLLWWDKIKMMRPDLNRIGHYDRNDGEYVPPEYFTRKRDKAVRFLRKIAVGLSIAAMFGLVVANEIANAKMTAPFYG